MLISTKFSKLPDIFDGLEFQFDLVSMPGVSRDAARHTCAVFKIRTDHALSLDALVSGHSIVESPDGGIASVLDHSAPVLVDVVAEPVGIFVGSLCVALSRDLSDKNRRWYYWKYSAKELFDQALAVL